MASGVTLHASKVIPCLKNNAVQLLSRFKTRATAENLRNLLLDALARVGLTLGNIRGLTTDGCSTMKKLGALLTRAAAPKPFYFQQCFAHALHLAVGDTLHVEEEEETAAENHNAEELEGSGATPSWRFVRSDEPPADAEGRCFDSAYISLCADAEYLSSWSIVIDSRLLAEAILEQELREERALGPPIYRGETGALVNKVRRACLRFHRSGVANDALSDIAEQNGIRRKFACDVKTRWNSTLYMLQNFITLEPSLREFYTSQYEAYPFSDEEVAKIRVLIDALAPVDQCVKRLSQADATMRSADLALQVSAAPMPDISAEIIPGGSLIGVPLSQSLIRRLRAGRGDFSKELLYNVCIRVRERRGLASTLSRFVVEKVPRTEIDSWLADVCDGDELTSSAETGSLVIAEITEAIARHGAHRPPSAEAETIPHHGQENMDSNVMDDFVVLMNYGGANSIEAGQLAADDVVELFLTGYEVLPADLLATMASLQPTSVPSERSFSHARHLRRSCQEKQDDDRYSSYLLLKDFYRKNRPDDDFFQQYPLSKECNLRLFDKLDEDASHADD